MSKTVQVEATWDGAMPRLVDPRRYRELTKAQRWPDGTLLLMKLSKPTRSDRANAYYWGVVLATIERLSESGNTVDELHEAFCEQFIPSERKKVEFFSRMTGETVTTEFDKRRSSALTGMEFYEFVEQVREFARTFWGIETEDPNPEYWRKKRPSPS